MEQVIYLNPKSLFPTEISSNTIVGAIIQALSEISESDIKEIISEKPPFLISSAFPYAKSNGNKEHFFPKLIVEPSKIDTDLLRKAKKFKKVKFVHQTIFQDWINGEISEKELIEGIDEKYKVSNRLLMPKSLNLNFTITTIDRPHNLLNRLKSLSQEFFYSTAGYFKNAGLFFMIRYSNGSYKDKIESALRFLADRGFGGNLSIGEGEFSFKIYQGNIIGEPKDGELFTTLSLYCPTANEVGNITQGKAWYALVTRKGRSRDGIMKKSLMMFSHGSTFSRIEKDFLGKIEHVRKDPPVVEWGYAFPLRVSLK